MSDIYARKSHWKWYLAIGGAVIIVISLLYTKYLATRLAAEEVSKAKQFAAAMRYITSSNLDSLQQHCDLTFAFAIIENNNTIPVVLLDENFKIEHYRNIGDNSDSIPIPVVRKALDQMVAMGADTIVIDFQPNFTKYLIYSHSRLLELLRWYPFIQLFLIAVFIAFGYLGFSAARKAEENQVWVGMAKETAHQLGTPITAIIGWIETLRAVNEENEMTQEMLGELRNDVTRLELVADRFSKIGAIPELEPANIYLTLERNRDYMMRRSPKRIEFDFPDTDEQGEVTVFINEHLFDWVIENLLRNAIDAMEGGVGKITANVYGETGYVCIDITDTGKGIAANRFKTVFKPGYSTKTRGWGLGLSLSKRIVEQYHRGKILVKRSEIGKGTTFTVKLPRKKG